MKTLNSGRVHPSSNILLAVCIPVPQSKYNKREMRILHWMYIETDPYTSDNSVTLS